MPLELPPHYWIALIVGPIFLIVQIACVIVHQRRLSSLRRGLIPPESPRDEVVDANLAPTEDWPTWVLHHFPEGVKLHGNFSRDDAFQELNWRLASSFSLSCLHRLGVIAPLLGVMITAVGFWGLELPALEKAGSAELVAAIRPVVAGVFLGGLLSILNQFFLQVAEHASDRARERARVWFDDEVWPRVVTREESTNLEIVERLSETANLMREFASSHRVSTKAAEETTRVVESSTNRLQIAMAEVSTGWRTTVDTLANASRTVDEAAGKLQSTLPGGAKIALQMSDAVKRFDEIIETRFNDRVRLQEEAVRSLSESAISLDGVVEKLGLSAGEFTKQAELQRVAVADFLANFHEAVVPNQERMVETAGALQTVVNELGAQMRQLDTAANAAAEGLAAAAPGLNGAVGTVAEAMKSFRGVVEGDFALAVSGHCESVKGWAEAGRSTDDLIGQLREAAESLAPLIARLDDAGTTMLESVKSSIAPSNVLLYETATALSSSSGRLTEGMDGLRDSLTKTTAGLEGLSVRAGDTLDRIVPPVERFRSVVLDHLGPAAESQKSAAESAASSLGVFRECAESLREACRELGGLIDRQAKEVVGASASAEILRTASELVARGGEELQIRLVEHIPTFELAVERTLSEFQTSTEKLATQLASISQQFDRQINAVEGSAERLGRVVESVPFMTEPVQSLVEQLDRLADKIVDLTKHVQEVTTKQGRRGILG